MKLWSGALLVAFGALVAVAVMLLWPRADGEDEAPAAQVAAPADDGVRLDAATQERLGIELATLAAATAPTREAGFARALDIAPLAVIDGDIAIARAAAAASAADLARLSALAAADNSASARSVQMARAQAAADAARVGQAGQRTALEFGPGLAALGDAARTRLVADVAAGRAALLRIDFPAGPPPRGSRVQVGDGVAEVIGAAAAADPRLQNSGVLAVLRGAAVQGAAAGRLLPATRTAASSQAGVIVPRAAVLRWHGDLWAYRSAEPGVFRRVELVDARPVDAGWFVAGGPAPGDRIVIAGAGALLAAERGAGAPAEAD